MAMRKHDMKADKCIPTKMKERGKLVDRRGYYTELVTRIGPDPRQEGSQGNIYERKEGAHLRLQLRWQVMTELHAPVLQSLRKRPRSHQDFLAPAERWMCYPEEKRISFPVDTFKAKIQMQDYQDCRKLPRNVLIERNRRYYQEKSIITCLEELKISPREYVPAHVVQRETPPLQKFQLYDPINYLPLELFDDEDFDCRTPEGWLNHGLIDGVRHPIPGQAFLPVDLEETGGFEVFSIPSMLEQQIKGEGDFADIKAYFADEEGASEEQSLELPVSDVTYTTVTQGTHMGRVTPDNTPTTTTESTTTDSKLSKLLKTSTSSKTKSKSSLTKSSKNLDFLYGWTNVAVMDYNSLTNRYIVFTLDGRQRTFNIPRIYLMMKAEDPSLHAARIQAAVNLRNIAENNIRYEFYVDCMQLTGVNELDDENMAEVYKKVTRNRPVKKCMEFLSQLIGEVKLNHKRALAEMQFRNCILKEPMVYGFIKVPFREALREIPKRKLDIPQIDLPEMRENFRWMSIMVINETYRLLLRIEEECTKVSNMSLFTANYGKYVPLDEFEATQTQCTTQIINYLRFTWVNTTGNIVRMCLGDVGKGWFNLNEKNHDIYDIAKLTRIMELIRFKMQNALRLLIENSTNMFTNMVEAPCKCTYDVDEDFVWGPDLTETPFAVRAVPPIFYVILHMNSEGAYYSTDPDEFKVIMLKLYINALVATHEIRQVHPTLLTNLKFAKDLYLTSIGLMDENIVALKERFLFGYDKAVLPLKAYAKEYKVHLEFFNMDVPSYIQTFTEEQHTSGEVKDEVLLHTQLMHNFERTLPNKIVIGPFIVDVEPTKTFLIAKRQEIIDKLLDMFCNRMKEAVEGVLEEYEVIVRKLNEKPISIEHIVEIKEWIETIPFQMHNIDETMKRYLFEYEVLEYFWYALPQEDFSNKWQAIGYPYQLSQLVEQVNIFLAEETDKFQRIHLQDEAYLMDKIENFTMQVTNMSLLRDFARTHDIAVDMKRLWKALQEAQEQGVLLNIRQKLFGMPVTPYDNLHKLIKEFEPYKNLWVTASDWLHWYDIWMDNPLNNIDGEAIESNVVEMYKVMIKLIKVFTDIPAVQSVAYEIRDEIDAFRPQIAIIQAVRNPGMRPRHWEEFREMTGIDFNFTPTTTFREFIDLGIMNYAEEMTRLAESAGKEFGIEHTLIKMEKDWENCIMDLQVYKKTGTFIMKIPEEILQMLDDHLVLTQQISFSPFKAAFEERIQEWEDKLKLTSEVLEEWMEVQRQWMYLEPIFTSEDISRQLPAESKKYNSMERNWKRIMRGAKENPKILVTCPDRKLLDALKDCSHNLEVVQKGLAEYLEMKRTVFPRLYFLSDDELLEILSQSRYPTAVQPHLRKCFENIARLQFEEDLQITKMFSADDECVTLNPPLYPSGNVENWLLVVESSMKNTVRTVFGDAIADLYHKHRAVWVLQWPGQIVIAGSQTYWTAGVEKGIVENKLPEFFVVLLENLDALRGLVKGTLTFLQREVLSALIVIEVHARDVTNTLVEDKVTNVNDFDWISQLRYYWIQDHVKIRAVNAEFQYGYEYLGNSGRLVITPLTDRCYLTLTGALHLKFGGAPAGPAGTGKTETTKDLAKAFAIQCVVFNCSDQLDFMAMGKFFKGLASSGAWACFDEFNRIDIEVLSVVAQQIMTIQKAQQARLERFMFEGTEIALKPSCAVFITMNPGYAGRTELPDNLKALFRPVSMMVPNYTLIAEISLFSFGFSDARTLAGKITTTFKLSSEQLSTQDHYDFGMRAVKTVISVAGNLKRENPQMDEKQIVLRSLRDVNVPKFLKDDLKLFNGIVSDLFPRMAELPVDYGILEQSIRKSCLFNGLIDVDDYVKKVIQLYETTVVRHGLMLVGPTGSGKTKCYEILKAAMTALKGKPAPSGYPFQPVNTYVLNPKSITMGQLYGEFDLQTHEWTDGILPSLVRIGVMAENKDKCWYVFDGPVDAVWIENMNTVLDDNKKLCLSSGEIIKLRDTQTMMFEVADLAVASPATVSRCGMVYLEPSILGLQPYLDCWLNRLSYFKNDTAVGYAPLLQQLFDIYLIPAIDLVRNHLKEILTSVDSALVMSFLYLLDWRFGILLGRDGKMPPAKQFLALMGDLVVPWVIWALIWSVGATCDNESRIKFSTWLRKKMRENGHKPAFPKAGICYDYRLHDGGFTDQTDDGDPKPPSWKPWTDYIEPFIITSEMNYADIEIPTVDNVRNSELIGIILHNEHNVLCVGPTGTGKTLTVIAKLSKHMPKKFICDFITFSARTGSNQTQDLLDSKLDKRRKGVYGPPLQRRQIFFIDDFNMPALEVYGAQPPIELIRQWMDFHGWYDRKSVGEWRSIVDVNFATAMGPPGGGRNPITARLLRHFHYVAFTEMEDDCKITIFGTILKFWLDRTDGQSELYEPLLMSSIQVYSTILSELLPTPAKTHYTFNLRDLSKVFQGILMMEPKKVTEMEEVVRLWYHECCRVFQDRLVNDQDRDWFDNLLQDRITVNLNVNSAEVLGDQLLLYGDFLDPNADVKNYGPIKDRHKLSLVLDSYLEEYNANTTKPMKLVLFLDAIAHVCRISRIIRQPMGNALLLGMGGSGRQSLTRLAAHMAEYFFFQIELTKQYGNNEWREDIKNLMFKAAIYKRLSVFCFSDTQIKSESFLEDLNNILNSGDVPNIYAPEELDKIYNAMRTVVQELGLPSTKSNLFACYTKVVRSTLHSVMTMSPIGEIFRARLRQFPALVNCCTIDWFSPWPDSALQSVALQFLDEIETMDASHHVLQGIVIMCQFMHASVVSASDLFLEELSRHNYVTPTSYLELLTSYTDLMNKTRGSLVTRKGRLKKGLDKIDETQEDIKILQEKLRVMKPALEAAKADAEIMITQIAADTVIAEETKQVVQEEEAIAAEKAAQTQAIADDAQKDLDEAMPALLAAEASLKALNKNDITEVRTMKRPPMGVVTVMETICIVRGIKPAKVAGPKLGEKIDDYWEPARGMMTDPGVFLTALMNFDKDSITEQIIEKLKTYVEDASFQPAKIQNVSKACTSLCMWIHAMYKYYFVNRAVAPKKAALAKAKEELAATEKLLAEAKARMKEVLDGLERLNEALRAKVAFREEKENEIALCLARMGRAVRLVSGLADEKIRWIDTIATIEADLVNVTGDILISSGAVAYLTPFTDKYRRGLLDEWYKVILEQKVPHTPGCNPVSTLGEPVVIRQWQLDGLPRDYLSTENAVLVSQSRRWPLFIDPQGQANKWMRNMGKRTGLAVCKLADKDLLRTLESAVRFGKSVLIENVLEELDPSLDPVLTRQLYRQGNVVVIKLGEAVIPYNDDFRLAITTKLPNPHYTPEVSIKVLVVNFTLVPSGLQDQLLALVVMQERPDLEEERSAIIVSSAAMKQDLKEIEDRILYKLATSEGSPVDDIDLIVTLETSKVKSAEIKLKVEAAEITQTNIDNTRALYIPVANRGQLLFFCLADLSLVDPMYQYSLEWFINIFITSMAETEKSEKIDERVEIINTHFTFALYSNVCRSLFERNKLHFAFLVASRIMIDEDRIDPLEYHVFLAGSVEIDEIPNPTTWLGAKYWKETLSLKHLPNFEEFVDTFGQHQDAYLRIYESPEPENEPLPAPFNRKLSDFQQLLVLKCLRPDKVTNAMQNFLRVHLGNHFIEPQTTDLSAMYKESGPLTPLIFVLSTGTDPAAELYKFAEKMKMDKRFFSISLGQGQGPIAENMIEVGVEQGNWVFFQNCHLAPSWMPRMERLIEQIPAESAHKEFRLWLTSTPSPAFPVAILQNGSKMTVEPPRGIKANMLRAYLTQVPEFSDFFHSDHPKVTNFKWLLFSLNLFHGVCLERRKFGPLGFNIPYEFTDGDLRICISQLHMFLLEYEGVPYKVLMYTAGHINYGGRVTDDWDRRCLLNILENYYHAKVLYAKHKFDHHGVYHQMPSDAKLDDYVEYIKQFPINDDPELFGLHSNADISCAQADTHICLSTLLELQPKQISSKAHSQEEETAHTANGILHQLPNEMDIDEIMAIYPVRYEESLNTVLVQEVIRYNKLLRVIQVSLKDLLKALKGLVVMSEALEKMSVSMFSNVVPQMWSSKAYPSLKPLGAWVIDLNDRVKFLHKWIDNGIPSAFWISGFYFPQAFLTGTLQNFARKYAVAIDSINFSFQVLREYPMHLPEDGCNIWGLYLEGARWNHAKWLLDESIPKELYTDMPPLLLLPEVNHVKPEKGVYECPVYKTLTRAGTLSTTGHSTNYVVAIEVPSDKGEQHWIKRGVALFCALDF